MILFKKVVSLKNIFINKSPWLHTLKMHTICNSLVEMGQEFMEVFDKEMLTSSFLFSSTNFHPLCYLIRALFRLKNNLTNLFRLKKIFCDQRCRVRDINDLDLKNFRIQVRVGLRVNKFTETELDIFIECLLKAILSRFLLL